MSYFEISCLLPRYLISFEISQTTPYIPQYIEISVLLSGYHVQIQIKSVGALKFFPRVKLHDPAVALPVSSNTSGQALGERTAELGHPAGL